MGGTGLLHLVQRRGAWAGCGPAQSHPRCCYRLFPVHSASHMRKFVRSVIEMCTQEELSKLNNIVALKFG